MKRWAIKMCGSLVLIMIIPALISCRLVYEADTLDLSFYQWNQWSDEEGSMRNHSGENPPSCGWEVLQRGNGNLVRIPATIEGYKGVSWYHCRFTLPELWDKRDISLMFEGAGPEVEVYLNEKLVGGYKGSHEPFEIDVTGKIYYSRDNHLAIRISDPEGYGGMTGNLIVKSKVPPESL